LHYKCLQVQVNIPISESLTLGEWTFCGETAAAFFSHNPFFISCCYYIPHFVTAVYFKFFQVSSITSKAIQNRNHTTRWQWWWSSTRPRRWKQALHAITLLNVCWSWHPVLLHISMMKHRTNLKISTADSEVIQTRVLYLCENLYSLSYVHIRSTIGQKFCPCPVLEIWETLRSQRLVQNGIPKFPTSSSKLLLFFWL